MGKASRVLIVGMVLVLLSTQIARAGGPKATCAPGCGKCVYRVKKGDNLYRIAKRYGTTVKKLKRCNHIRDVRRLRVGKKLVVPCKKPKPRACRQIYKVRRGDTLWRIARRTCSTVPAIILTNHLVLRGQLPIRPGQRLCIPWEPNWCR